MTATNQHPYLSHRPRRLRRTELARILSDKYNPCLANTNAAAVSLDNPYIFRYLLNPIKLE